MGIRTGKPRGRPKGSTSKVALARQTKMQELSAKLARQIENGFQGDSHEFLMTIYKSPDLPMPLRLDAAKAAIPFEKPRLAAVEHSGGITTKQTHELTDDELIAHIVASGDGTAEETEGPQVAH